MSSRLNKVLSIAVLCFAFVQGPALADANQLPNIGSNALSTLSYEKEMVLGDILMRQTRARLPVDYDPLINEYINTLGNRLVTHADDIHFPFNFFVVKDKSINAFAFFGGNVAVNTGLIALADTESEVASVMAHEIAHVTQRHLSRRFEAQQQSTPLTLAGILGGILLAVVNPEAGMAAMMASQAGAAQASINFTRSNEQEADRIGIKTLAVAGFDPHAAPAFFDKLAAKYRYTSKPPAFLLTHPLPESRVADSRLRAQRYPSIERPMSLDFQLIKSRVLARYQYSPQEAVSYFENQLKSNQFASRDAILYGLALALTDAGELKKAEILIKQLLNKSSNNLYYIDTYVDLLVKKQAYDSALAFLAEHYKYKPNNAVITLNYANVAVEAKKPELAIELLSSYRISKGEDYIATDLLTRAYGQIQNLPKYHEMRAERFAMLSLYDQSIEELKLSIAKLKDDKPLESKRLAALQDHYKAQLNQIKQL